MTEFGHRDNPNLFSEVVVKFGDQAQRVAVAGAEYAVLAAAADQYGPQHEELAAQARSWVEAWHNTGGRDSFPPAARHLGDGCDAVAFACEIHGAPLVMRVPNLAAGPDDERWSNHNTLRLLAMARSAAYNVPNTERLVTFSQLPGHQAVFSVRGEGRSGEPLTPHELLGVPQNHIAHLRLVAAHFTAAGLTLDTDTVDTMLLQHTNSTYTIDQGSLFYDLIPAELFADEGPIPADVQYAYMAHDLASTGLELGVDSLPPDVAASRLIFLARSRWLLECYDSKTPALQIFDRSLQSVAREVSEQDFVHQSLQLGVEGHPEGIRQLYRRAVRGSL